ncbi:uncharacterized protein LOC125041276 [Penaeus chinensis]|uniref:uncharacterized protein LOC125041276 n=1 Tax=Penaeus chinensis TaxID=139456 RepID=UPI001FB6DE60|nr:uncharacterized protein LOC125041276 [Penaeus chinensis]
MPRQPCIRGTTTSSPNTTARVRRLPTSSSSTPVGCRVCHSAEGGPLRRPPGSRGAGAARGDPPASVPAPHSSDCPFSRLSDALAELSGTHPVPLRFWPCPSSPSLSPRASFAPAVLAPPLPFAAPPSAR